MVIQLRENLENFSECLVKCRVLPGGYFKLGSERSFTGRGSGLLHVGFNFDLGWFEVCQFARVKVLVGLEVQLSVPAVVEGKNFFLVVFFGA